MSNGHQHEHQMQGPPTVTEHPPSDPNAVVVDHAAMGHVRPAEQGDMKESGGHQHGGMSHDMSDPAMAAAMERDMRNRFVLALVLTIPTVLYSSIGRNTFNLDLPTPISANWIMLILTTPVVFWAGWNFISGAYYALRSRQLDMSVLISTGVLAAYGASLVLMFVEQDEVFFEAATMLVTFVLLGHWLEMRSRRGTTDALRALFDLVPPTAFVQRNGQEIEVPTAEIVVGDIVVIRPGDKIPVDGEVLTGETSVDEALVTGESLPVDKAPGDPVIGGSINRSGTITFRATRVGSDTALARIVSLVQEAQASKAPGQRLADRAAAYLVIVAVGSGLLTFAAWMLFSGQSFVGALTFAISAVVIACPDALGLATPTAVAVGTGLAARENILIKNAATLEGVAGVQAVILDKTGTLTEGKPRLMEISVTGNSNETELLTLAAAAESGSEHPLSRAIVEGANERNLPLPEASAFKAITGRGVEAKVDGRSILIGNRVLMEERRVPLDALSSRSDNYAERGWTPMFVAVDGQAAGVITVADAIKPSARQAVKDLQAAGIDVVMMTGDNKRTAATVAKELGIDRFFAEVLPEEKAKYVAELQAEGKRVAMVGDGVNDAPALAKADIGIAIGAGTDVAIETANVVLMRSDPSDLKRLITISKATVRTMKQNLGWASIYNLLAIPIAAGILYPAYGLKLGPEWAALLMSLSSIIVAVNAVLLKRRV